MQTYRVETLLLLVATVIVCPSTGQPLEYLCSSSSPNASNYQVTLLLNIHYGPDCSQRNPRWRDSTLPPEVLKWQTKLQAGIGFNIVDTCGNSDIAAKAIAEIIPYSWTSAASAMSFCTSNGSSPNNIGFITETLPTGYGTESRLLGQAEVPLILTSDDIIKSQSSDQSSVIAVGDELQTIIEMMSKLMVEMEWDFVTVVYSDDAIGRLSVELFQNISMKYYICMDKSVAASYTSSPDDINTVGVVLLGSEGIGLHLLSQLTQSPKVWVTGHDISGLAINNGVKVYSVVGESGSQLVINSLVSFSKALEEAENRPDCSSAAGTSQCARTQLFRTSLKQNLQTQVNLNLTSSINGDGDVQSTPASADAKYRVYFHKESTTQVADMSADGSMSTARRFESSLCLGEKCREQCRQLNEDQYTYIHGEWVIVLFLPIHERADPNDPWSCVGFSRTKLFRTEAAVYALNYLKQKLVDDRFGLLIIDSCGYKLKPAGTLYEIIKGIRTICNHLGECLVPKTIVQYVGDFSSAVTQQLQTVTRELPAIHMSYGASSVTLNDREDYPYFLRTNPADDLQAHFMVELLKALNKRSSETRINAVNIIYTDGLYGRTGAERVKEALVKARICVHLERKVNVTASDNNLGALADDLFFKTGNVKITVVFLDPEHITQLMQAIQGKYPTTWSKAGLSFILSDTWNDDLALLENYGEFMAGSFSFKIESGFSSTLFRDHLKEVGLPVVNDRNVWLSTLVQEEGKCKIRGNFRHAYQDKCNSTSADLTHLDGESFATHVMKAITSTIYGIRSITYDQSDQFLFDANKIKERYQMMLDITIPTTLETVARNHQPFTPEGNGRVGYSIYNLKRDEVHAEPAYYKVHVTGSSFDETVESFLKVPQFYQGTLPSSDITSTVDKCEITVTTPQGITSPPSETATKDNANNLTAPLIAVSALLGLLLVVIVVTLIILFLCYWKKRKQPSPPGGAIDEDYDQISYLQASARGQRGEKFVDEWPSTSSSFNRSASDNYVSKETIYHALPSNRPVQGADNAAYCDPEVSALTRGDRAAGATGVPTPKPRHATSTGSGIQAEGSTYDNTSKSTACAASSVEEEEHRV